jgi:hypothetical protein
LGYEIGNIDGIIGFKTNQALEAAGISGSDADSVLLGVENLLQQKFPGEYRVDRPADSNEDNPPGHVIG